MTKPLVLLIVLLMAGGVTAASGQGVTRPEVRLELSPVVSSPRGEFASPSDGVGAGTGYGIGARGLLGWGMIAGFAGYRMNRFSCDACRDVDLDDHVTASGWEAGVRVGRLEGDRRLRYWAEGGVIGNKLAFSGLDSRLDSERGTGYVAGGGVGVKAPFGLEASAALGVRRFRAGFGFPDLELPGRNLEVSYLDAGVGVGFVF